MSGNRYLTAESNQFEKYLGITPDTLGKEQNAHNIRQDRYDGTLYSELREASGRVRELEGRGTDTFPALLQDLWASFYKADPTLQEPDKVNRTHQVNRTFVERLLEDSATKEARLSTMLDEFSAGIAATQAGEQLVDEINSREELRKAMQNAQKAQNADERGDPAQAEEYMKLAEQALQSAARDVRRAVRESVKAGQEKTEETMRALSGWGLQPGDLKQMPIGDRLELAQTITSSNLKRIADLVGKMRNLAKAKQQEKIKKQRDEIHSITMGGELNHTLPVELAALKHPLRRLDFYRKHTEKQLLQYELEHQERQARGPIVACIDISGSMAGARLEWAVACSLALADTASRQKRHCHIMFFDTEIKEEFTFSPGERSPEKYIQMTQIGVAGGTDYHPALARAVNVIGMDKNFEKADIVMVTDGVCYLRDDFQENFNGWRSKQKMNCYTILIGGGQVDELKAWNDKVWQITDLQNTGNDVAGELFQEVY